MFNEGFFEGYNKRPDLNILSCLMRDIIMPMRIAGNSNANFPTIVRHSLIIITSGTEY
jgi:hypothetical protein